MTYMWFFFTSKSDAVEVFYSTPSRYLDAINKVNKTWTVKTDDFFPYADGDHSYWTGKYMYIYTCSLISISYDCVGYYSSRPGLKAYVRTMNSLLQSCKQIEVLGERWNLHGHTNFTSRKLKLSMALVQHHDAVT